MQHQTRIFKDFRKLYRLYEKGTVFTAFDTETTGLSPSKDRIIEIGAVKFNKDGIISTWSKLFNPGFSISPFITNLTHITQKMLDCSDCIENHLLNFIEFIGDSILIAHNAQFDLNFINAECQRINHKGINNLTIDTLQASRWAYPMQKTHKLSVLAQLMNIDCKNAHRATDDAETCKEVFLRIIKDTMSVQKI